VLVSRSKEQQQQKSDLEDVLEHLQLSKPSTMIVSVLDNDECTSMNEGAMQMISMNLVKAASIAGKQYM